MMKIFGWKISFYCDTTEWGIPFGFSFWFEKDFREEITLSFLCFGVVFVKDT